MKRRIVALMLCVALLATGTIMAQGEKEAAAKKPAGPVTIDFWYSIGGNAQKASLALVEKFNNSQNEVFVDAMYGGSYEDTTQKLLAAVIAGEPPVVAHMAMAYTAQFVQEGYFEGLNKYFAADAEVSLDDFVDSYLDMNRWKGELYGMPFNYSNPILYYNKDLFKAAGLDPNKPPTTWAEVYEYSKKISALGSDVYGFNIERGSGWISQGHTWQFGGNWIAPDNSTVLWTEPGAVEALSFMQKMYNEGLAVYRGGNTMDYSGKVGMVIRSTASITNFRDSVDFDFGIAPQPYSVERKVPIGGGSLYVFGSSSKAEKDAAWKFLKFMGSKDSQMFWTESTGYQVSSIAALESAEMQELWAKDSRFKTTYEQVPYSVAEDRTGLIPFNEVRSIFNDTWDEAILKNLDPAKAMADAQVKANKILAEYK